MRDTVQPLTVNHSYFPSKFEAEVTTTYEGKFLRVKFASGEVPYVSASMRTALGEAVQGDIGWADEFYDVEGARGILVFKIYG